MRWIAGFLLVGAAVLKAAQLLNEPTVTTLHPLGSLYLPLQIGAEFALGLLVLLGVYWRALRWFTVLLFSGFATYSLYLALNGAASCGCFGPVHVHPWTTFILDIGIVVGLLIASLRDLGALSASTNELETGTARSLMDRRQLIAVIAGVGVVTTALLVRNTDRRTAVAQGISASKGGLVILETDKWIGQKLPIAEFVDADLSNGDWLAVLYRHDCPACHEAMPRYEELASMGQRVALIEIPPYGKSSLLASACHSCQLKDDREWFVQTPVEIDLRDGIVVATRGHGH